MSNMLLVTASQTESVRKMANEKKIGRAKFQQALDRGLVSRFLNSLLGPVDPKSPSMPPHLYEFTITKDGADALTLVEQTRKTFYVSVCAETMTNNRTDFVVGPKETAVIRVFTAKALRVSGWPETDFFGPKGFEHVKKFGLLPCLSDDAFGLRFLHGEQQLDEWILIAHSPVFAPILAISEFCVFFIGYDNSNGRYVHGYNLRPDFKLKSEDLVALRVAS